MSKSGLSERQERKLQKKFDGYLHSKDPVKAFTKFLESKPNDAAMDLFIQTLDEYAYNAEDKTIGEGIANAAKNGTKAGNFLLSYATRHEETVRSTLVENKVIEENDSIGGYEARAYLKQAINSRAGEKQQLRDNDISDAIDHGNVGFLKFADVTPKELDKQDYRDTALKQAYEDKKPEMLQYLFEQDVALISNVFGGSFLQQPEPPEVVKPGAGQKELEKYHQDYESYEKKLEELEKRKEFAEEFMTDAELCSPEAAELIAQNGASPSGALGVAVQELVGKDAKPTPLMTELLEMGGQPSMALETLVAQKQINQTAVDYLLTNGNFTQGTASASVSAAARSGDNDTLEKMVKHFKEANLLDWKDELRAYASMEGKLFEAMELMGAHKNDPDFVNSVNNSGISGPFAKLVKNAAFNGEETDLNAIKESVIDPLPAGTMKDLLAGELIIGYARLGNTDKIKKLADNIASHIEEVEERKLHQEGHINNLSSSSLFAAINAEQKEAVELLIGYGANVNTLVAETNAFPLKAAHETGNEEIFNLIADQGALVRKSRGNQALEQKLTEYHENHPEAKLAAEKEKQKIVEAPAVQPAQPKLSKAEKRVIAKVEKVQALKAKVQEAVGTHQTEESVGAVVDYTVKAVNRATKESDIKFSRKDKEKIVENTLAQIYSNIAEPKDGNNVLYAHEGKDKTGHIHRQANWKTQIKETIDLKMKGKNGSLDNVLSDVAEKYSGVGNKLVITSSQEELSFSNEYNYEEQLRFMVDKVLENAPEQLDQSMINSHEAFEEFVIEYVEPRLDSEILTFADVQKATINALAEIQPEKTLSTESDVSSKEDLDLNAIKLESSDSNLSLDESSPRSVGSNDAHTLIREGTVSGNPFILADKQARTPRGKFSENVLKREQEGTNQGKKGGGVGDW